MEVYLKPENAQKEVIVMGNIQKTREQSVRDFIALSFKTEKTNQQVIDFFNLKKWLEVYGNGITESVGPGLAEIIINNLFELKKEGEICIEKSPTLEPLIWIISDFASCKHATRLTEMLLWNEICLLTGIRRWMRSYFLRAIKRVGDVNSLCSLKKYKERVKKTEYYALDLFIDGRLQPPYSLEKIRQLDQREVDEVISFCRQRPAK